ncbi:MAG: methylated-DNA--[protein]-cysteine S-methyltransferase [Agromyces sp.]
MLLVDSPVGTLAIRADVVVQAIRIIEPTTLVGTATPLEQDVARELEEYFAGERTEFTVPLAQSTNELQHRVWEFLDRIPFGEVVTYGHIARELGYEPGAARAIGGAVGANPVLIVRPCHRVLGADGSLTGYAGGIGAKVWLLQHEGVLL